MEYRLLSPLSPLTPFIPVQIIVRILRLRQIEYGRRFDAEAGRQKLWFDPISNLRADLHKRFGESIRVQRAALEWLIDHRRTGWPAHEAWLTDSDWHHWEFVCYRANCDLLTAATGKAVRSFGVEGRKVWIYEEKG